jgi:hypothetical protein
MEAHPDFREIGKRMLASWQEGIDGLRGKRSYDMGPATLGDAFANISDPIPTKASRDVVGQSDLLAKK